MPDLTKLNLGWFDHRTDVPSWVASGIGQINVEWSVLERELEETEDFFRDREQQNGLRRQADAQLPAEQDAALGRARWRLAGSCLPVQTG